MDMMMMMMVVQVLVFMRNKKFSYIVRKKSKFLFLLLTIIMLLPALQLSKLFSCHFVSIWSYSACSGGIILGENAVLHLENEPK